MPDIDFPTWDIGRVSLLEHLHTTALGRLAAGDAILDQALVDETGAFLTGYKLKVEAVGERLGQRRLEIEQRDQAKNRLDMFVRDFLVVLKRRMRRNGESASLWALYGVDLDGALPHPKTANELLYWGEEIVAGDVKAVEAGFPAMVNPSAAEVQAALEQARAEVADVPQAELAYDEAQAAAAAGRDQADALIRRANMMLDYKLYGLEAASVRRVKRTFGFTYRYRPDEPHDPDDPAE